MFTYQPTIRFNDTDALRHVNNTLYFIYFEEARTDIFRIFNPSLDIEKWNLIVASTTCDFLQQVRYGEKITVFTWIGKLGNTSFEVHHAIQNGDSVWVARGKATLIRFDYEQQKPVPLSDDIRAKLLEHSTAPEGVPALRA